jgi:V8-like Glu-specific endopeptidase
VLSRDGVHFCTASVVHSERRDLIVTAAHCLGDGGDLVFAPGYRDGRAPYGEWAVTRTYVSAGWEGRKDEDSDVAFARVAPRSDKEDKEDKEIEDVVGANTLGRGHRGTGRAVTLVGYPKSRETPVSCTNLTVAYGDSQQRVACPGFSGGTSGSPWLDGRGHVVGVLGGHLEGGDTDDVSYSVVLGDEAAELYRTAGG